MAHLIPYDLLPQVVRNRIPDVDQFKPLSDGSVSTGSWTVTSGNATLAVIQNMAPDDPTDWSVLEISPTDSNDVVLTFSAVSTETDDNLDSMKFMAQVKSTKDLTFQIDVSRNKGAAPLSTSRLVNTAGDRWVVIRGEPLYLPFDTVPYSVTTEITIKNHEGYPVYLYHPVLMPEYGFRRNTFLREVVSYMPRVLIEQDRQQEYPSYPLVRMIDLASGYAAVAFEQYKHFYFRDSETGADPGNQFAASGLVDPDHAEVGYLQWLGSITGNELLGDSPTTTPWVSFPSAWQDWMTEIDTDNPAQMSISNISNDGSGTVTVTAASSLEAWVVAGATVDIGGTTAFDGQFEIVTVNGGSNEFTYEDSGTTGASSETSGTVDLVDNSWDEIERYALISTTVEDFWRWQIKNGYYARKAGTNEAFDQTLKFFLSGTKSYTLTDNGIFTLHVETLTSETRDGVTGSQSAYIIAALEPIKPIGFKLTHECVASL